MRILVLGAGAIGGYFGGRLAQAGVDVAFLVRPARREQLARDGLVIESPLGEAKLAVKTLVAGEPMAGFDLVLFTCKAYDLDSAMDAIAPAVAAGACVLPLLNGLAHLDRLDARFSAAHVMGGSCQINAALAPDGTVRHMEPLNRIVFGERDGTKSDRARAFAEALGRSTIDFALSDDIVQDLWEKFVFLASLAAVTCLMRGTMAEILAAPGGRELAERALEANAAIAAKEGHAPREPMLQWARLRLTTPGPQSASMLRDMEAGKPVEADHIVGHMLELARKHGVDDTVLAHAFTHLKTYEARRAAGRVQPA
jgi:2-dehydropantoate 2-reductase